NRNEQSLRGNPLFFMIMKFALAEPRSIRLSKMKRSWNMLAEQAGHTGRSNMDTNQQAIDYMKKGKYEEAAKCFNALIEEKPDDPVGFVNFGNLLLHMNDLSRAKNFFEKAIQLDADAATAYYGLG